MKWYMALTALLFTIISALLSTAGHTDLAVVAGYAVGIFVEKWAQESKHAT